MKTNYLKLLLKSEIGETSISKIFKLHKESNFEYVLEEKMLYFEKLRNFN